MNVLRHLTLYHTIMLRRQQQNLVKLKQKLEQVVKKFAYSEIKHFQSQFSVGSVGGDNKDKSQTGNFVVCFIF